MREKPVDSKWVGRFLYRWQFSYQASNTKGAYLPDTCLEMKETRLAHRTQRVVNEVPFQLVLNFDQLWKAAYEPPKRVLHKRRAAEASRQDDEWGEVRPDDLAGKRLQAILSMVEGQMTSNLKQTDRPSKLRRSAARTQFVQGGRCGVTAVTSTWASGEMGPLGICLPTGALARQTIQNINDEYAGHVLVFESGTDTHFMNADTTLLYLEKLIGPVSWKE